MYENTKLVKTVIDNSLSNNWVDAVKEWDVGDRFEEDLTASNICICGNEGLRYLFSIVNINNGTVLFPIGSTCIKKFKQRDLNITVNLYMKLLKLYNAIANNTCTSIEPPLFSKRVLQYLYDNDAFVPNEYNHYNPYNDYNFMLKMFNKQNKNTITINQKRKITCMIRYDIFEFLEELLKNNQKE